jgi:NAD(P)H-dependent FMN reductase
MDDKIKIEIILGSIRQARFGERPARWVAGQLKNWEGVEAELVDLKDYPLPMFDAPMSPARMERKYPNADVQRWADKLNEADAFIIVTPEYNHGYPGALKNALDWTYPEWARKPVGFVSYGAVSGARAIEQLRVVMIEFSGVPIRRSIHIGPSISMKSASTPGISDEELFSPLRDGSMGQDHLAGFMGDLLWMARALKEARGKKG